MLTYFELVDVTEAARRVDIVEPEVIDIRDSGRGAVVQLDPGVRLHPDIHTIEQPCYSEDRRQGVLEGSLIGEQAVALDRYEPADPGGPGYGRGYGHLSGLGRNLVHLVERHTGRYR